MILTVLLVPIEILPIAFMSFSYLERPHAPQCFDFFPALV